MARVKDLTGQKFGSLIVVGLDELTSKQKGRSYYMCQCECGNQCSVNGSSLTNGCTHSCGCMRKKTSKINGVKNSKDLTGQSFGKLTVIQKTNKRSKNREVIWLCQCECGNYTEVKTSNLTHNNTHSCGCSITENAKKQLNVLNEYQRGELHPTWKGGISSIKQHLHDTITDWFIFTKQQVNYTCQLTRQKSCTLHSHHLYSFNSIIIDAHEINNIEIKPQVKDYTKEELQLLENYVNEWHKDTSNCVVLCDEVHKLFHQEYGYGNNTPEQFEEFKQRYFNGEFNKDNTEVTHETKAS